MKKLLISLGTAAAFIAPVATVIACGDTKFKGAQGHANSGPTYDFSKVNIKDIADVQAMSKPYSVQTLMDDAKKYKDDSRWVSGISQHALWSALSAINAIADSYGFRSEKNDKGLSAYDKYLMGYTTDPDTGVETPLYDEEKIDDSNIDQYKNDKDPKVNLLANLKQDTSSNTPIISNPRELPMGLGGWDASSSYNAGLIADNVTFKYSEGYKMADGTVLGGSANDNTPQTFLPPVSFDDVNNPKKVILLLKYQQESKMFSREISLDKIKDSYPVIEPQDFVDNYVPFIKATIIKLSQFLDTNQMVLNLALGVSGVDISLLLKEIEFIQSKNTIEENGQKILKFDDENFARKLLELDKKGAIHWLAAKAFYEGFDNSFTSTNVAPFAAIGVLWKSNPTTGYWTIGSALHGVNDWDTENAIDLDKAISQINAKPSSIQLLTWIHELNFKEEDGDDEDTSVLTMVYSVATPDVKIAVSTHPLLQYRADRTWQENLEDNRTPDSPTDWESIITNAVQKGLNSLKTSSITSDDGSSVTK